MTETTGSRNRINDAERKKMSDSGVVNIHGKAYETVALRVKKFRDGAGKDLALITSIVERTEDVVVMKATICTKDGQILATGHSEEYRKASQINRTSALENAETSAIGRALAAFGFGGTEFATADEVANAIAQQKKSAKPVTADVWDSLDDEAQKHLQNIADCVRAELDTKGPAAAMKLLEEQGLDADAKVALWSRFDSKERSALKNVKKEAA